MKDYGIYEVEPVYLHYYLQFANSVIILTHFLLLLFNESTCTCPVDCCIIIKKNFFFQFDKGVKKMI